MTTVKWDIWMKSLSDETEACAVMSSQMVPVLLNLYLATVLVLSTMCAVPLQGQRPGQVDPLTAHRANPQCWDSSSELLLEMRSPRIADTVSALWDLMVFLRSSDNSKHTALYWDLARVFWDIYVDCVLSRSHGLGRRHVTAVHSLITDSKCPHTCVNVSYHCSPQWFTCSLVGS